MRWVKPLDCELIESLIEKGATHIATLEEHVIMGGAGSAVNEYLLNESAAYGAQRPVIHNIGISDQFAAHGSQAEQLADCALDTVGVAAQLRALLS